MIFKLRTPSDRLKLIGYIQKLPDKPYDVTVNLHKVKRTIPQNRLYWLWINCISKETGNEPDDLHDYFGTKWLPKIAVKMFGGDILDKNMSTTQLTTVQFKEYLDKIQAFASTELGVVLPNPDDLYFDEMVDFYANSF